MVALVSSPKLTETSYAVLGLLEFFEPATPYQLKQVAQVSVFHFWSIPHTQLYTECARLAEAGLLNERREQRGRRRRLYRLSAKGRKALKEWRADPNADLYELKDPGLLKLFCGADRAPLAEAQLERHRRRLAAYEEVCDQPGLPEGVRLTLESGIGHQQEYIRFWSGLLDQTSSKPAPGR
jgi:DNA-binding PadR family transcriptional regulator